MTFAEQMVAKIQEQLIQIGGAQSITVDGERIDVRDLEKRLAHWEAKVRREQGGSPAIAAIDLS